MRKRNKGLTLLEILISTTVSLFIVLSTWSVYVMGSAWWTQFMPRIEAQRIARIAVKTIIYGSRDNAAGTDSISGVQYSRRNGIAWATALPTHGVISPNIVRISYNIKNINNQSFFTLKTENPMKLYHNNVQSPVSGTTGLTGLSFELPGEVTPPNTATVTPPQCVTVTATVERDVHVGGQPPYHVKVELAQTVFLRNI